MPKYTITDLKLFAAKKGGDCISDQYKTNETIYEWRCENNHQFTKTWLAVKVRNAWCLECKNNNGIASLQKFAEENKGTCLSTVFTSCVDTYLFQCENNHQFSVRWSALKAGRQWCLECKAINIDRLRKHAEAKGGRCLSDEFKTTYDNYTWECSEGHTWQATWINVGYGNQTWCKQCTIWSFSQIEEKAKEKGCINLEHISGTGLAGTYKFTCEEGHSWVGKASNLIYNGAWCSQCLKLTLEIARQEAILRGGICLETEYVNRRTEMKWQCGKGHVFSAPLGRIRNNNSWCKTCNDDTLRHDISVAYETAKKNGGKCHSTEYVNLETPLDWECERGHRWSARLGNVICGSWCNPCVMIARRDKCIDRIYKWVETIGGRVITEKHNIPKERHPKDISIEILCSNSHKFSRTLATLMTGSWCPKCRYKSEEACRQIFESIYNSAFPKKYLKELERLQLDVNPL